MKISETMRRKKIDNFAKWREKMIAVGLMNFKYPAFKRNGDLAELIGVILGDGHLSKFPRTEELTIFSNANNPGFIKRYATLLKTLFKKKPYIAKTSWANCVRIRIYQKDIKTRLGVPYSPRRRKRIIIPGWILANKKYIV